MGNIIGKNRKYNEPKHHYLASNLSASASRKNYHRDELQHMKGMFCDTIQEFICIPINPNLRNSILDFKKISNLDIEMENKIKTKVDMYEISHLNLDSELKNNKNKLKGDTTNIDGLMNLFYSAYANHGSVIIRPDDIWFHILQQIGKIINENHEALREHFVSHEGKKKLSVCVDNYDKENTKIFINDICEQIRSHVVNDTVDLMCPKYSSTSSLDHTMNSIACMTNMQNYFIFIMRVSCGIRNIWFGGTLNDWIVIKKSLKLFENFGAPIKEYVTNINPIIDEFILAYQGCPNIGFFNKIFREDAKMIGEFELGYGNTIYQYITGWILNFYKDGKKKKNKVFHNDFASELSSCPFIFDNHGIETNKMLYACIIGIKRHNDIDAYSLIKGWASGNENSKNNDDKYNDEYVDEL